MSDNQARSSNYFIPVVLIVLSLITSVLLSQIFFQDESGSDVGAGTETRSEESAVATTAEPRSENSGADGAVSAEQPAADAGDTGAGPDQPVIAEPQQQESAQRQEQEQQQAPEPEQEQPVVAERDPEPEQMPAPESPEIPVIADLTLLVPANDALCDGQNPWGDGDRELTRSTSAPGCYGLRFELAKPATVLLLRLSEGSAPRSLLAQNCRPFGFNSARFEPEQVQRLPRGMNAQPGVFQVGPAPSRTRFVLVAAGQPPEQLTDLETGVANLCGQSATLTNAEVQTRLDGLAQLQDVSVKEVVAEL